MRSKSLRSSTLQAQRATAFLPESPWLLEHGQLLRWERRGYCSKAHHTAADPRLACESGDPATRLHAELLPSLCSRAEGGRDAPE